MSNDKPVGVAFADPALVAGWSIDGVAVSSSAAELNKNAGVTAGTATASKTLVVDANKRLATLGAFTWGEANTYWGVTSITAHAGGGQGSATAITGEYNLVTVCATAGDSVVLPTPALGKRLTIKVSAGAAASCAVFPPSGGTINNLTADSSMSIAPGGQLGFFATSATAWHCAGGLTVVPGQVASPKLIHTGNQPPLVSTDGTDTTPAGGAGTTITFWTEIFVPCNMLLTGVAVFKGSAVSGNLACQLADSSGALIAGAKNASVAMAATGDIYQRIAFATPYYAMGPATYYVGVQADNNTARLNCHTFGNFNTQKVTNDTFGTFTAITPNGTFGGAGFGVMASLY